MIILLLGKEVEHQWANLLSPNIVLSYDEMEKLHDISDEELVLLDLSADGCFQNRYQGELGASAIAKSLMAEGLPKNLKRLILIISDVHQSFSLFAMSREIALAFKKANLKIEVCVSAYLDFRISFIIPDSQHNLWKVYGVEGDNNLVALQAALPGKIPVEFKEEFFEHPSVDFLPAYEKFKDKVEIFSGNSEEFLRWIKHPQRTISLNKRNLEIRDKISLIDTTNKKVKVEEAKMQQPFDQKAVIKTQSTPYLKINSLLQDQADTITTNSLFFKPTTTNETNLTLVEEVRSGELFKLCK